MSVRKAYGKVRLNISCTLKNTLDDGIITASQGLSLDLTDTFQTGVGAGECNRAVILETEFTGSTSLVIGDNATFDVGAGSGKDALGIDWDAQEIVAAILHNDADSTGAVTVSSLGFPWLSTGAGIEPSGYIYKSIGTSSATGYPLASGEALAMTSSGTALVTVILIARNEDESSLS